MADRKLKFATGAEQAEFDRVWAATGYQYGEDALEGVRLGWRLGRAELARYHDAVGALLTAVYDNDTNATIEAVELVELLRDGFGIGPAEVGRVTFHWDRDPWTGAFVLTVIDGSERATVYLTRSELEAQKESLGQLLRERLAALPDLTGRFSRVADALKVGGVETLLVKTLLEEFGSA